jgi:uncharacterized protein (TIGR02284 family)
MKMTANENLIEVLNDLIQINNDRIEGYEKAAEETKDIDVDLKAIFIKMAEDSIKYKTELINEVSKFGGTSETGTSGLSKLHRVWMDVKAAFASKDRQSVLEACEFGEDAAQKAYRDALASDAEISADTRQLITSQQESLKTSHDIIKKYRDMHKAVNS